MSEQVYQQNILALQPYLVKCPPERVDLATSDSAQFIKEHVKLSLRHVDSRGRVRKMTLKFGILKGLRFDMVIGLYAISFHFMEVIQDLLTLQLESLEAADPALAVLYGSQETSVLTMINASDTDGSQSPTESSDTDSVVEDYLRNGFDMRPLDQREYMVIYDADPVEPYQPMMTAETARQAKRLADLREANNPPPARCTRSQTEQESASPDSPPVASAQPFVQLGGDFRLRNDSTQLHFATRSSSSNLSGIPIRTINQSRRQSPTIMSEENQDERPASHIHAMMASIDQNPEYLSDHLRDDPACITPLRRLSMRLQSFLAMIDTPPLRGDASPGVSLTSMTNVTAQISVDLGTANPVPLHHRDVSVANSQREVFDSNVHRHLNAFPEVNTSSSSSGRPNSMALTPWQLEQFSLLGEEGEAKEGAAAIPKPNVASSQTQRRRIATGAWEKRAIKASKSSPDIDGHKPSMQEAYRLPQEARPLTRSMSATSKLQSSNYRTTQPAQLDSVLGDEDMPGLREDNSDEDIPDLIGNTGVADSDEEDFVSATRRRAPTVPWHRSGRHRVTDDQKKARAQRQAQLARQTLQQPGPVMVAAPRSPIIAGLTLNTMVQNTQFFDEGQISDQRQYELGLPPLVPHNPEDSPNEGRYQRAFAYMMQARGLQEIVQPPADRIPTAPQQASSQPMQVAQTLQQASDEAEEYASRRFYKDDPNNAGNPRRMPQAALSHLPSATAVAEALPATTVYMDAGTMEMIPQARVLQSYADLLDNNDRMYRALAQAARDTEPDWPLTEPTYALPTPKRARMVVQYRSPPTSPTIVQMVSNQEEPSHGYNVNSPAYFVPSLSPSTTPESGQRRPATCGLRDTTTQRRVPPQSDADGTNISPNPTHDPNRG
jgi:hypothetical protein